MLMGAVFVALIFVSASHAQPRRGAADKVAALTQAEAQERWKEFSSSKIAGDYCLGFSISHNPRRGESVIYKGLMFGSERNGSTMTRIIVRKAGSPETDAADFILKNSRTSSKIWRSEGGKFREIPESEWHKPMLDGLVFSPFDILMPYRWWESGYKGPMRMGKAVHVYSLKAPDKFSGSVSRVEIALTRDFNSPAQTEIFGAGNLPSKTVSLGAVKKLDGLWIISELSARDNSSRDSDRLKFRSGAVKIQLPESVFSPENPALPSKMPELKIF